MNTSILLTGARAPSTLFLARKLNALGYKVIVADCINSVSKYSNAVFKAYKFTPPNQDIDSFKNDLLNIIKNENVQLLIPTCEEIFYISKIKSELKKHCKVLCDSHKKLVELHDKYAFYGLIKSSDIDIKLPKSYQISSYDELENIIYKNPKKYILKPIFSRFATSIRIIESIHDIADIIIDEKYILQEFISGVQICSYSLLKDKKLLLHSDYETRLSAGRGATIAFEPSKNSSVLSFIKKFAEFSDFYGQIGFDFIVSNDELYLIECNPRLTSGVTLFDGSDFEVFLKEPKQIIIPKKEAKLMLVFAMLMYPKLSKVWLKTLLFSKDVIYDPHDLKPAIMQIPLMASMIFNAIKNKVSLKDYSTYGIAYNGEEYE